MTTETKSVRFLTKSYFDRLKDFDFKQGIEGKAQAVTCVPKEAIIVSLSLFFAYPSNSSDLH